ncbi:hybrid sensor histidine kinase/response regulator [Autumnicola musiva]|uniref:histidine kinase n=1 Tax=Autumnicola musiva TaxID=3075589 RepID=A0ABU3D5C2_9FLAO|nr:response regulator [Zunongwangia sp. F117]MDT0676727.1 response regulator [Zunongwangia sp. F117]
MKRSCFTLIFLLWAFVPAIAQTEACRDAFLDSIYWKSSDYIGIYNYNDGISEARKLIEEARFRDNNSYLFHAHNLLGASYTDLSDTLRAKGHYENALEYAEKSKNDTLILWAINNLGNIYADNNETANEGITYYEKAIHLATELEVKNEILYPTVNIAWTYLDNEKLEKAKPYLDKAWRLQKESAITDNYLLSQLNFLTGRYYAGKDELKNAKAYFEDAIEVADEFSYLLEASMAYKAYAKLLFKTEDFKEAYAALDQYEKYNSQIFEKDRLRQIEIANARFDNNKYQHNLELAESEQEYQAKIIRKSNEKLFIMLVSSIILVVILFSLNKINRDRKKLIEELKVKNNQLQESKNEAERLSKLKTQFFSTVSHEIRTPLYGVIGLTSLLLEDKGLKKHENDLKSLKFSADYLLALINDVLQMNKMESNLVKLDNISFHLKDLMASILNTFEFSRVQNSNKIHMSIDKDIPSYLMGDPVRLSQILMNLVGNAVKFTEMGNIYLSARLEKVKDERCFVYFEVKDDGIGIPENKQAQIFEEFSQLRTANYNYQGTGLGLPIVKKLLELHNSEIYLESKEEEGSTFSFEIEFEKDIQKQEKPAQIEQEEELSTGEDALLPKKILIVDDNRINQVVTSRILEKKNFRCEVAGSGEEAIEILNKEDYHLVLMDLNMPGIGGLKATGKIRSFNSQVPIVALTAVEVDEMREKIFTAGMNDIIVKPYDVQQFYRIIYRNIDSREVPAES